MVDSSIMKATRRGTDLKKKKRKRLALKRKKAANIKGGSTISTNHLFIQQKRGESFLSSRSP